MVEHEHEPGTANLDAPDALQTKGSNCAMGPAVLLVGSLLLLETGNVMVWTFAESIGEQAGMSVQYTSTFLGLSQLIGLIGSGITLALGARVPKMVLVAPTVITLGVGNLLVGTASGATAYTAGFLAINLAFFCLTPLLLALAAELDTSAGRLVVVAGGVSLVAGAVAPALAGWIAGPAGHWSRLGVTALILVLATLPLLIAPVRAARLRAAAQLR
jgi:hypothetical protein